MKLGTMTLLELFRLKPVVLKSYSKYILRRYSNEETNNEEEGYTCECIGFFDSFISKQKLDANYKTRNDCNIIYMVGNLPRTFPNSNCNAWRADAKGQRKHRPYHCRLAIGEKEYYKSPNDTGIINRWDPRGVGLPNCDLIVANHVAQYAPIPKNGYLYSSTTREANTTGNNRYAALTRNARISISTIILPIFRTARMLGSPKT